MPRIFNGPDLYDPGDQPECDLWFPRHRYPVGADKARVLPVLVSSYSRFIGTGMSAPG